MIRASRSMVLACAATALALHGAGLWVSGARGEIEIEGGAGAAEAALGSSFADMVAGAAQPVSDSTVTPNRQSDEVVNPNQPGDALRADTPETAPTPPPERREAARVEETVQATPPHAAAPVEIAALAGSALPEVTSTPSDTVDIARASEAETAARAMHRPEPTETTAAPTGIQAARSVTAQKTAAPAPQEVVEATPETEDGLHVSRRPQARPREIEEAAARQAPEPERKAEVRGNSGSNAERDVTRGSVSGTTTATATRQGRATASRSDAQGNAAASNYPGAVMRHLARVPRPRAEARGAVLVQFAIAEGGALASVGVARSSGSTRLDSAALTVIRRAAPFPAPPSGAQRRFSVKIEGR